MKRLAFGVLILSILCSGLHRITAQEFEYFDNGSIYYQQILEFDYLEVSELNERIIGWFGESFQSGEDVLTTHTDTRVIGNFHMRHGKGPNNQLFRHKITIELKPGRIRGTIDQIECVATALNDPVNPPKPIEEWFFKSNGEPMAAFTKMRLETASELQSVIQSLKYYIENYNSDDW